MKDVYSQQLRMLRETINDRSIRHWRWRLINSE